MKNIINFLMNKRGQLEIVGAIVIIGIIIFSGVAGHKIISENRYVGDITTNLYYDLKKCDIVVIPKENIVNFKDLGEAKTNGFNPAKCSL